MEYRIQQKATIWYETSVKADSPEDAVKKVQEGSIDLDWWQVNDSTDFQEEFWWEDEDGEEGEITNEN